jgi:SnoaL-like domain
MISLAAKAMVERMNATVNPLQRLLDKDAISDVLLRYARGIDRLDVELFRTVFWEDGGFEDGIVEGPAKEFIPSLLGEAIRNMFAVTQHFISNVRIEFDGPDVAFAESYFLAFHLLNPDVATLNAILGPRRMQEMGGDCTRSYELYVAGRYFDRFEKREDQWRILKRRFVSDWTSSAPDSGLGRDGFAQLWKLWGSRDRADPSYLRR